LRQPPALAPDEDGLAAELAPRQANTAGHSVDVLLRIYARCVAGQDKLAKRRISEALRQT